METVTLSSKGQFVIPKGVRNAAQLAAGTRLQVQYIEGEIRLRALPDAGTTSLDAVAGCLRRAGRKPLTEAQTQAAIRAKIKARNAP